MTGILQNTNRFVLIAFILFHSAIGLSQSHYESSFEDKLVVNALSGLKTTQVSDFWAATRKSGEFEARRQKDIDFVKTEITTQAHLMERNDIWKMWFDVKEAGTSKYRYYLNFYFFITHVLYDGESLITEKLVEAGVDRLFDNDPKKAFSESQRVFEREMADRMQLISSFEFENIREGFVETLGTSWTGQLRSQFLVRVLERLPEKYLKTVMTFVLSTDVMFQEIRMYDVLARMFSEPRWYAEPQLAEFFFLRAMASPEGLEPLVKYFLSNEVWANRIGSDVVEIAAPIREGVAKVVGEKSRLTFFQRAFYSSEALRIMMIQQLMVKPEFSTHLPELDNVLDIKEKASPHALQAIAEVLIQPHVMQFYDWPRWVMLLLDSGDERATERLFDGKILRSQAFFQSDALAEFIWNRFPERIEADFEEQKQLREQDRKFFQEMGIQSQGFPGCDRVYAK